MSSVFLSSSLGSFRSSFPYPTGLEKFPFHDSEQERRIFLQKNQDYYGLASDIHSSSNPNFGVHRDILLGVCIGILSFVFFIYVGTLTDLLT